MQLNVNKTPIGLELDYNFLDVKLDIIHKGERGEIDLTGISYYDLTYVYDDFYANLRGLAVPYGDYIVIDYKLIAEHCGMVAFEFELEDNIHTGKSFSEFVKEVWQCKVKNVIDTYGRKYEPLRTDWVTKFHLEIIPNKPTKHIRKRTNVPKGMRHEVFKRDNYTCCECGASKEDGAILHIDHIIPVSKGGTDELSNLQTLCRDCNLNKSDVIQ